MPTGRAMKAADAFASSRIYIYIAGVKDIPRGEWGSWCSLHVRWTFYLKK